MKILLCATDFSKNSFMALKYASYLSKLLEMELVVIHIYEIPTLLNSPSDATTADDLSKGREKKYLQMLYSFCENELKTIGSDIRFEKRENKSTVDGIISLVNEIQANLIVIGVKGVSKLKELIMGHTSMGVIKKAPCPVITIPEEASVEPSIQRIAFSTDLDENSFEIINSIKEITIKVDANISIVHISKDVNSEKIKTFQKELSKNVKYKNIKFELLHSNNKLESLSNYVRDYKISLIAMFEHESKSIFDIWFKNDLLKKVEFNLKTPLMSFNQHFLNSLNTKQIL